MKKEEIIQTLKDNPIKIIKCGDIEIPVEYLKQTTVNVDGDDYIRLQQENKILKENAENNDKVVDKVNWENQLLKKENKQLKIQISAREEVCNRLENNWNKLKEYLEKTIVDSKTRDTQQYYYKQIYEFVIELEQGSDNE